MLVCCQSHGGGDTAATDSKGWVVYSFRYRSGVTINKYGKCPCVGKLNPHTVEGECMLFFRAESFCCPQDCLDLDFNNKLAYKTSWYALSFLIKNTSVEVYITIMWIWKIQIWSSCTWWSLLNSCISLFIKQIKYCHKQFLTYQHIQFCSLLWSRFDVALAPLSSGQQW